MALKLNIDDYPKPAVRDRASEAGLVEQQTRGWSRQIVVAIRALAKRVEDVAASVSSASSSTAATTASKTAPTIPQISTPSASGTRWYSGTTVPASSLGSNGDFYLLDNPPNAIIYQKSGGVWS